MFLVVGAKLLMKQLSTARRHAAAPASVIGARRSPRSASRTTEAAHRLGSHLDNSGTRPSRPGMLTALSALPMRSWASHGWSPFHQAIGQPQSPAAAGTLTRQPAITTTPATA